MDRHDDLYITIVVFANAKNDAAPNTKPPLAYALLTPHHARLTYVPVPKPSSPSFDTVFNLSCIAKKRHTKKGAFRPAPRSLCRLLPRLLLAAQSPY
jgi:hypothetical protein